MYHKFYYAIIKRKLQHNVDLSKFMGPNPLDHYAFLHRINTFGARNIPSFKKQRT